MRKCRLTLLIMIVGIIGTLTDCSNKNVSGKYISIKHPRDYIELDPGGPFILHDTRIGHAGKYEARGGRITLTYDTGLVRSAKIEGKSIIFKDGDRWTKQDLSEAELIRRQEDDSTRLVGDPGSRLEALILGKGEPVVVFSPGFGASEIYWDSVQTAIAEHTTTFAYLRGGFGWSDPGRMPRTARQLAVDLRAALRDAGLPPPFILVGVSAGGFYDRVFAHMFPNEIAGMVLVDPSTPEHYESDQERNPENWKDPEVTAKKYGLDPGFVAQDKEMEVSIKEVKEAWPLPRVPVVIMTGTLPTPGEPELSTPEAIATWVSAHEKLAAAIPGSEHLRIAASHGLLDEKLLTKKILEVLAKARQPSSSNADKPIRDH